MARVRYQQPLARCTVRWSDEASPTSPISPMLDVAFDQPLRHVAEQQVTLALTVTLTRTLA